MCDDPSCPSLHVKGDWTGHHHNKHGPRPKLLKSSLEAVGSTPLVQVDRFAAKHGLKCKLFVKCEFFNTGGSVKDRIGLRMVEEAEKSGRIKPGDTLIEPTSGNTGIGLALAAAVKGYRMIITLPQKMSLEKVNVLKALGAEIIRTPTEAAWDSPESHISVAERLNKEIPNSHILDQYINLYNPLAHYDNTAEEILESMDGDIDMIVMGAGTGGTMTGISRKVKKVCPKCVVVAADPHGSILALPETLNNEEVGYQVEGIGYDFIPNVCQRDIADEWVKTSDKPSFLLARDMIRTEGLLCGGSSGSALQAALEKAKDLGPDKRVVVVLPDSVRNYMTKFLDPEWMIEHDFADASLLESVHQTKEWWSEKPVSALNLTSPFTILPDVSCEQAIKIMTDTGYGQLPVVSESGSILGTVTEGNLLAKLGSNKVKATAPVTDALYKQFRKVDPSVPLGRLSRMFDREPFVLVVATTQRYTSSTDVQKVEMVVGVATRIDLLRFIAAGEQ